MFFFFTYCPGLDFCVIPMLIGRADIQTEIQKLNLAGLLPEIQNLTKLAHKIKIKICFVISTVKFLLS